MAPQGGLFVKTALHSVSAFGTAYGPQAKEAAFEQTAVELEAYAPPSRRIFVLTQTSFPSRLARCSCQTLAGWRWTWPAKDSSRL